MFVSPGAERFLQAAVRAGAIFRPRYSRASRTGAIIGAPRANFDRLREGIQHFSRLQIQANHVYQHVGWKQILTIKRWWVRSRGVRTASERE